MSKHVTDGEAKGSAPESHQSGMQIFIVCVLFVAIPTILILAVKYFFGL